MCAQSARVAGAVVTDDTVSSLVQRIRSDDQTAIAELYRELYPALWRLAVRVVQSSTVAEDVLHDVFFGLWNQRHALQPGDDVRAYVYRSVRNRALNHARHDRVIAATAAAIQHHTLEARVIGRIGPTPDEAVASDDFYRAYRRTLATLTERERAALQLRWDEELPLEQIAEVLGMSIEGVRKLILRAQKKLQTILAEYRS